MKVKIKKADTVIITAINIVLVVVIFVSFALYNVAFKNKLTNENLNNIANINQSTSVIAASYFAREKSKLSDIVRYANVNNYSADELLNYIALSSFSDDITSFELVGLDCIGQLPIKDDPENYKVIDYTSFTYGKLQNIFLGANSDENSQIRFTPIFTDQYTAVKSFALYTYLSLRVDDITAAYYTLMSVSKISDITTILSTNGGYDDLSSVITDESGNYIISNDDFKATNFFDYIYNYNNLSLDERNYILAEVVNNKNGELYFLNSSSESCVFSYAYMEENGWYCITCVPLNSFHSNEFEIGFTIFTAAIFISLFAVDVFYLLSLNRRLRLSMIKEKEANNAKTDFLSRMSHDIRTPLNGIIGSAYLAKDESDLSKINSYLNIIDTSGKFLLGLINDILDMSKVESGRLELIPEEYSYSELCEYLYAVINPLCQRKNIDFHMQQLENDLTCMFDRLKINQIFFNLLSNAVKFTGEGGRIDFLVNMEKIEPNRAAFEFTVKDNGIGMSDEFQEHMFEAFSQEKSSMINSNEHGTGLGLAIVWNLVSLMNGRIIVESKEGKGSAFHIYLESEIVGLTKQSSENVEKDDNTDILNGKHVLLCDDNEVNIMLAQMILEKHGVIVDPVRDGAQALAKFNDSAVGYYDAVLMDLMMPVMDGTQATSEIRALKRQDSAKVPIIAMTANAYEDDVKKCLENGMNSHVAKPIDPEKLYEELALQIKKYRISKK